MSNKTKISLFQRLLIGSNIRLTLIRATILVIIVFVIFKFVLIPVRCDGISMEPTYSNNSIHLVNKLAYHFGTPQRGDIISIRTSGEKVLLMKRIIGLPGERISIKSGQVYINDEPLDEPWMNGIERQPWNRKEVKLNPNEYLVIGDNRTMPIENHEMGEVYLRRIIGKVIR